MCSANSSWLTRSETGPCRRPGRRRRGFAKTTLVEDYTVLINNTVLSSFQPPQLHRANVKLLVGSQRRTTKGQARSCQSPSKLIVQPQCESRVSKGVNGGSLFSVMGQVAPPFGRHTIQQRALPARSTYGNACRIPPHEIVIRTIALVG